MLSRIGAFALALILAAAVVARADEGNEQGSAQLKNTTAVIGGNLVVDWRSVTTPFAQTLLAVSDGLGPTTIAVLGDVCLDLNSPGAAVAFDGLLDANGEASLTFAVPNIPSIVTVAPVYAVALVVDFSLPVPFSLSKTIAVHFENRDGSSPTNSDLAVPRALHTATALAGDAFDNEIELFIAGGGNGGILNPVADVTTEIFSPLTRTYRPGPDMTQARVLHQGTRLDDGRVLITGGTDNVGIATATCEIFDPETETLSSTTSMGTARAGHLATMLDDGRVLVTGGLAVFSASIATTLNSVINTGEIYDPNTGLWSPVSGLMAAGRFGHAQAKLNNGQVLITGGIDGAFSFLGQEIPTYTNTCTLFDPNTDAFTAAASFGTARGAHGMSVLSSGNVLITGGIVAGFLGIPEVTANCQQFNGASWGSAAALPSGIALHTQVASPENGDAILIGGLSGSLTALGAESLVGRHSGASFTTNAPLGTNPGTAAAASPRGSHTCTPLWDGTLAVIGGTDGATALGSSLIYLED